MSTPQGLKKKITRNYQLVNISKLEGDSREFRGLILPNKLKVVLVCDPGTRNASVMLEVGVGYMCDPDNIPGLAHLLEHMLFLGTQKYPRNVDNANNKDMVKEADFVSYIDEHDGMYKAQTFHDRANYYCEIISREFDGALDRFAQIFIAPLIPQNEIKRAVESIHYEYERYRSPSTIKYPSVLCDIMDPKHPFSHFPIGNKVSLEEIPKKKGIDMRHELFKFFERWYSSNIMSLVVYGKDTLDELEKMVVEKFSDIKNRNVILPKWPKKLFRDEDKNMQILMMNDKDIADVNALIIAFITSDIPSTVRKYIEDIFSYSGKNSLESVLFEKGWIQQFEPYFLAYPKVISLFHIGVILSEDGLNHEDEVVTHIFQYINLVKKEGPQKWLFDDMYKWEKAHFEFDIQREEFTMQHILKMIQLYSFEDKFPLSEKIDWQPNLIENFLNELVPSNCFTILTGERYESLCTQTERWYNIKYTKQKISRETLEKWENCTLNENFKLPPLNPFTPTEVYIRPVKTESEDGDSDEHPKIIYDTPIMRIWHKQNSNPKMDITFEFLNPSMNTDPLLKTMSDMLIVLFNNYMEESKYLIKRVQGNLEIENRGNGIWISLTGYNGTQMKILEFIFKSLFDLTINESLFEKLKGDAVKNFESKKSASGKELASTTLNLILSERQWSPQDCLDVIPLITIGKLQQFILDYLSQIYIEGLTTGNINRSQTLEMADFIKKFLREKKCCPILSSFLLMPRERKLSKGDNYLYKINMELHGNSCTLIYFQCEYKRDTTIALLQFLYEVINDFIEKERFRFDVDLIIRVESGSTGLIFIVETTKHPALVEERINRFLKSFQIEMQAMSYATFEKYKEAVIRKKTMVRLGYAPTDDKMAEFFNKEYHFYRLGGEVNALQNLNKEQFVNYFKINFFTWRRCLSIYVISILEEFSQDNFEHKRRIDKIQESKVKITDIELFKYTRGFFPCPQTYHEIKSKGMEHKF